MNRLFIVVPAYNEAENIRELVRSWHPVVEAHNEEGESRLVVINDGSRDQTLDILESLKEEYPFLVPLSKKNGGHGDTVLFGYLYALAHGADYIFQTDADGQTDPKEFGAFWAMRREYAAQFGNRTVRGDGKDRAFVEKTLCAILRVIFRVNIPDSNAPFRLMTADFLRKYIPKMPAHYNLPNVMLTTFAAYYDEKVRYVPITFRPRQGGTNSINPKKIVKIGWQALKDFLVIRKGLPK